MTGVNAGSPPSGVIAAGRYHRVALGCDRHRVGNRRARGRRCAGHGKQARSGPRAARTARRVDAGVRAPRLSLQRRRALHRRRRGRGGRTRSGEEALRHTDACRHPDGLHGTRVRPCALPGLRVRVRAPGAAAGRFAEGELSARVGRDRPLLRVDARRAQGARGGVRRAFDAADRGARTDVVEGRRDRALGRPDHQPGDRRVHQRPEAAGGAGRAVGRSRRPSQRGFVRDPRSDDGQLPRRCVVPGGRVGRLRHRVRAHHHGGRWRTARRRGGRPGTNRRPPRARRHSRRRRAHRRAVRDLRRGDPQHRPPAAVGGSQLRVGAGRARRRAVGRLCRPLPWPRRRYREQRREHGQRLDLRRLERRYALAQSDRRVRRADGASCRFRR